MENLELVLIPALGMSQFFAEMELARRLVAQHPRISVTVLIPHVPISDQSLNTYFKSLTVDDDARITVVHLPPLDNVPREDNFLRLLPILMEAYKPVVKKTLQERAVATSPGRRLAGFVLDMFCSSMVDVADELGVPSYFFFAAGASMLSTMFHFESLGGEIPATPSTEIPGFRTPVPLASWPSVLKNKQASAVFLRNTKRFLKSKGVLVNTFMELEPNLIRTLAENERLPQIYPIGPVIHVNRQDSAASHRDPILSWLDAQPQRSVVFLCFGTIGTFEEEQVKQIALGLERSGHRFIWSLRRQPEPGKGPDYEDFNEVLPEGFLHRTAGVGKVIAWAPQREVLGHEAVGAFVSHCGWNSLLESLWCGVPVAAWPLYAEQQLNAFQWVKEMGIATEMRIDYFYNAMVKKGNVLVGAEEVEKGIRRIMEEGEGIVVRKKVEEMSDKAKEAPVEGGASHQSLGRFIEDVIKNVF